MSSNAPASSAPETTSQSVPETRSQVTPTSSSQSASRSNVQAAPSSSNQQTFTNIPQAAPTGFVGEVQGLQFKPTAGNAFLPHFAQTGRDVTMDSWRHSFGSKPSAENPYSTPSPAFSINSQSPYTSKEKHLCELVMQLGHALNALDIQYASYVGQVIASQDPNMFRILSQYTMLQPNHSGVIPSMQTLMFGIYPKLQTTTTPLQLQLTNMIETLRPKVTEAMAELQKKSLPFSDHEQLMSQILSTQAMHYSRLILLFNLMMCVLDSSQTMIVSPHLVGWLIDQINCLGVDSVTIRRAEIVREFTQMLTAARSEIAQTPSQQLGSIPVHNLFGQSAATGGMTSAFTPASSCTTSGRSIHQADWIPAIAIRNNATQLILDVYLPGVTKDFVSVKVGENGNYVSISGSIPVNPSYQDSNIFINERLFGNFSRIVQLPCAVDGSKTTAKSENGVFEVKMTKLNPASVKID
ncbi:hypothetical protein O5D80_002622 [Batrachochytrium dendrobatidis]|nr:hypothetical protein O5D80_002622 [Batrachochytrium dendrobatidis]